MVLLRGPAAVDHQGDASDQSGRRRGEEDHCADDVLDLAEAAERDAGPELIAVSGIGEPICRERSHNRGRPERDHAHVTRRELHRE